MVQLSLDHPDGTVAVLTVVHRVVVIVDKAGIVEHEPGILKIDLVVGKVDAGLVVVPLEFVIPHCG